MLQRLLNARSSLRPHGWTSARTFESYSSVAGAPRLCSFGTVCARSYTWDPPAQPLFFKFKGCHHFCRSHVVMRIAAAVRNTGVVSNSHGWVPGLAEQFWFKVAPRSTKLGHRTTSMRRSWTFWRSSSWPVQCRGKISCRTMWPVCCSSWPRNPQGVTLWMRLGKPCGVGNWVIGGGVSLGGLADQCQEHLHSSWGERSCGCCSERPSLRWSSSPNHAPFAAHLASPIASFAATRSAENATSSGRFVPSVQVLVQISLAAYVMSQGRYAMEAAGHVEGWDLRMPLRSLLSNGPGSSGVSSISRVTKILPSHSRALKTQSKQGALLSPFNGLRRGTLHRQTCLVTQPKSLSPVPVQHETSPLWSANPSQAVVRE